MPSFKLQNQKRPSTVSSVSTLKPLLFQYSLYRFIAYSIAHSAAPTKVPPGADRPPPPPLATLLVLGVSKVVNFVFYHSKLRKSPFLLKFLNSCPLPTPMFVCRKTFSKISWNYTNF